jgi:hypothetical protein
MLANLVLRLIFAFLTLINRREESKFTEVTQQLFSFEDKLASCPVIVKSSRDPIPDEFAEDSDPEDLNNCARDWWSHM